VNRALPYTLRQNRNREGTSVPYSIRIISESVSLEATLNDSPTAVAIWEALPLTGRVSTWGAEIYFRIPVQAQTEPDARAEVSIGDLAYWPPGSAFCLFFGPTPASNDGQPVAASPVNVVGQMTGDLDRLHHVRDGVSIRLERA
jgi:uncharacterized protein